MIKLTMIGKPISKQRPRFRSGRVFDKQSKEKRAAKTSIIQQMARAGVLKRFDGEISVNMTFYTTIPISWSHKRRKSVVGKGNAHRPDIDNYVKFYFDVMNELVYKDDGQITELYCKKIYSNEPRVEISICEQDKGE